MRKGERVKPDLEGCNRRSSEEGEDKGKGSDIGISERIQEGGREQCCHTLRFFMDRLLKFEHRDFIKISSLSLQLEKAMTERGYDVISTDLLNIFLIRPNNGT
jgi:hypothetical protein